MIVVRRSTERGHANHGWLDTYYTFSFADYHDPEHMGFSVLRVINQDVIAPGRGFGTHGHRDMEIITWVLDGIVEHKDGMGNTSQIVPGDVQVMSAGSGITHSEYNGSADRPVHLLQMWLLPTDQDMPPRYEERTFAAGELQDRLRTIASGNPADDAPLIGQDARVLAGRFSAGAGTDLPLATDRCAWVHCATGDLTLAGVDLLAGDGVAVRGESRLEMRTTTGCEAVAFILPA